MDTAQEYLLEAIFSIPQNNVVGSHEIFPPTTSLTFPFSRAQDSYDYPIRKFIQVRINHDRSDEGISPFSSEESIKVLQNGYKRSFDLNSALIYRIQAVNRHFPTV